MMREKSEILMSFFVLKVTWNIPTITHKCTAYRTKNHFMLIKNVTIFRKYFKLWKQP